MGQFKCSIAQIGGCQLFWEKALRRCKVQRYYRYEGMGGGPIFRSKALNVTFECPFVKFKANNSNLVQGRWHATVK